MILNPATVLLCHFHSRSRYQTSDTLLFASLKGFACRAGAPPRDRRQQEGYA
jgi:hypothetical protein